MQRAAILPPAASLTPSNFSILSHKRHDFRENVIEHEMFILIFSSDLFETFLILRIIRILAKIKFFQQSFEESLNIKFHQNPFSGSLVIPCGRTDRQIETDGHDKANSRFSQFCEHT